MRKLANSLKLAAAALVLGMASNAVLAAPATLEHVVGQADWMVHVDLEQFRATQLGERVRQHLENSPKAAAARAYIQTAYGLDLDADLLDVTLFGQGADAENAVLLLNVGGSLDQFLEHERARKNAEFREQAYNDRVIYSSINPKDGIRRYMSIHSRDNGSLVAVSQSIDTVKAAVDVIAGDAPSAAEADSVLARLVEPAPGAYFQLAANNLAALTENKPRSAMFQNIAAAVVQSGEAQGESYLTASVTAVDQDAADNMREALEGLLAMGRLRAEQRPDAGQLVDAVSFEQDAATLHVDVRLATDAFLDMLQRRAERH